MASFTSPEAPTVGRGGYRRSARHVPPCLSWLTSAFDTEPDEDDVKQSARRTHGGGIRATDARRTNHAARRQCWNRELCSGHAGDGYLAVPDVHPPRARRRLTRAGARH